ncbi:hypothetical protein SDC9_193439 [bioreactor metagenome]|uniref:Uncharacterized protein n=1 Tax=bioreactor metagenome TaxID=1076179 RepID=A0A645IC43_9ZZZZ
MLGAFPCPLPLDRYKLKRGCFWGLKVIDGDNGFGNMGGRNNKTQNIRNKGNEANVLEGNQNTAGHIVHHKAKARRENNVCQVINHVVAALRGAAILRRNDERAINVRGNHKDAG